MCIVLCLVMASGCTSEKNKNSEHKGFDVYFYSPGDGGFDTEKYDAQSDSVITLVYLLMNRMYSPEEEGNLSVFGFLAPEDAQSGEKTDLPKTSEMPELNEGEELPQILTTRDLINDIEYNDRVVTISFGDGYNSMDNLNEVIFRTAVVKTLCQITRVDYVTFYVNGYQLRTESGNIVGLMNDSSFITDTGDNMSTLLKSDFRLYFAEDDGQSLICENIQMAYDKSKTIEQAVVERLIKGPVDKSLKRTLPSETKLLGISVKDGVAYVNLDSAFIEKTADVSPEVTIYSIVNSLCELDTVDKVQILVNGTQDGKFREIFPLSSTYEKNTDIVSGSR